MSRCKRVCPKFHRWLPCPIAARPACHSEVLLCRLKPGRFPRGRAQECSAALKVPAAALAHKNAEAAKRAEDEMLAARNEKERLQMLERASRERVARVVAQVPL